MNNFNGSEYSLKNRSLSIIEGNGAKNHSSNRLFSVDSEDRVYDSKDNYFAVIENATDIKLKGKKPARLYNENKGYLGQDDQWVTDKDQAKIFESQKELKTFLNLYFKGDSDDSQLSFFDQFTVSNEVKNEVIETDKPLDKPLENKEIEVKSEGESCLISDKECYEKVLKEWRSSEISDDVTLSHVTIYTPNNSQKLADQFIGCLLTKEGKLKPDFDSFKVFFDGGYRVINSTKDGENNPFTCAKLFNPRQKVNDDGTIEPIKYEIPIGKKLSESQAYFLPHFNNTEVTQSLIQGIIDKQKLGLKASDFSSYPEFFDTAKKSSIVYVSEGDKKAVKLISDGYLAISLPSVTTWGIKDKNDNPITDDEGFRIINPHIKELLKDSKELVICFDSDSKKTTIKNVTDQCNQLALAIHRELGINVKRRLWDSKLGKGIDDLLTNGYTLENNTHLIDFDLEKLTSEIKAQNEIKRQKSESYKQKMSVQEKIKNGETSDLICNYKDEVLRDLFSGYWFTTENCWYRYNGKFYDEVETPIIKKMILTYLNNYIVTDEHGNPKKPHAKNSCVNEVYNWIKTMFYKKPDTINTGGIPLENGILVVTENSGKIEVKLEPHRPDKYFTYCSEVKYNPKANLTEAYKLLECLDEPYKTLFIQSLSTILNFPLIRKKRDRVKALILEGEAFQVKSKK